MRIAFPDAHFYDNGFIFWDHLWLVRFQGLAHAHPALVVANISIRNGTAWGKGFAVVLKVWTSSPLPRSDSEYLLDAEAQSVSRFASINFYRDLALHPDYLVGKPSACEGCEALYVRFTPYVDPADLSRLMQFNLDCITRWRACRTQNDIMPVVWAQIEAEDQLPYKRRRCSAEVIELTARDAENAAIIEIASAGKEPSEPRLLLKANLMQSLKRATFWKVGSEQSFSISSESMARAQSSAVRPHTKWIALFDRILEHVDVEPCGLIPLNDSNLKLVQQGVVQDYAAAEPDQDENE